MSEPLRILSLGGGTQSCALALMSARGDLPRLDHVVFADTQGELPETYEYIDFLRGELDAAGIPLHVVTGGNLERAILGERAPGLNPTPPLKTVTAKGEHSRINGYKCSYDFKRRQIERKVKALCGGRGAWKTATVEQWIGYSSDEMSRCKPADGCRCGHARVVKLKGKFVRVHTADGCTRCRCATWSPWQVNRWPLIELRMRRDDTIRWFKAHGYPTPPRSACWFCPNSGNARWQALKADHADLFERACVIDDAVRHATSFGTVRAALDEGQTLYVHESRVALRDADLRTDRERIIDGGQGELFGPEVLDPDCDAGGCFT